MSRKRTARAPKPLSPRDLRWRCPTKAVPHASTERVEPVSGVLGQDAAVEALRFGFRTQAPGQNIFVRGLSGTGRLTLVRRLVEEIQPSCPLRQDRCYVHHFAQPDRPRLLSLPAGQGRRLRDLVDALIDYIREELGGVLDSESTKARRGALEQRAEKELARVVQPFEAALKKAELALVNVKAGDGTHSVIFPIIQGKPTPPETFEQLRAQGEIDDAGAEQVRESIQRFQQELEAVQERAGEIRQELEKLLRSLYEDTIRSALGKRIRAIEREFPFDPVRHYLAELTEDVLRQSRRDPEEATAALHRYRVNVVLEHEGEGSCPVIAESNPTMRQLLGTVDFDFGPGEEVRASHMGIRAGSLLRADGGYLILEARDVLNEPGAWKMLTRTLRTGKLEIVPPELTTPWTGPSLKPEPIEISVKVVLIGDSEVYYLLDSVDSDFSEHFKVLADFDTMIPRDETGLEYYTLVLARIAREEKLPHFDRGAIAALAEHGARIAARQGKLTARFGRLADVAREAAFLASEDGRRRVKADDVRLSVQRGKSRASLPSRRFREMVSSGIIRIQTEGEAVGQINGLAVLGAGPLTYGFPARITATIGPGSAGVINIEREAALSGAIHTKGFYILGGLLRHLLRTEHPLAFSASIAFEQSYGGIDGDSASGAEMCCLLSALTGVPLRQDLAMTGAIDQRGNILAIGAVNEKIEGFFDACADLRSDGRPGVIIPRSNAGDLMLRPDVVEACREKRFRVYAVETLQEALHIFTGMPAGEWDPEAGYAEGTLLALAMRRAREFWMRVALGLAATSTDEEEDEVEAS